jgi:hypothetical protein
MEKETRSAIEAATQKARRLLESDFQEQLDGVFDVRVDGRVADEPGAHLDAGQRRVRRKIVAAIEHKRAGGMKPAEAVADYLRDAAFTVLNRFVALKMLEARELVQPCVSQGEASSGFNEFCGFAPGARAPDGSGYRLYLECLFDELSTEVKVLFDRRDAPSAVWPRRGAFLELLDILNATVLAGVWAEDETIGWVYQYFNGQDERRAMRDASQAPRNSRELAVRNQFFTPRYVVQFLTDNTLGRIWYEMRGGQTSLAHQCEYIVRQPDETWAARAKKDPRDLRVLDPACGSGHFLLYAFDLLLTIYHEAWGDPDSPASEITGGTLRADYPDLNALKLAMPGLILAHNLHGVDIDPRCAQIAQLALWMRAQRAFRDFGIRRDARLAIRRSHIIIAEPMPGEADLREEFLRELTEDRLAGLLRRALDIPPAQVVRATPAMAHSLKTLVETVWDAMSLAGELGVLLKIERTLARAVERGRAEWEEKLPLFRIAEYGVSGRGSAGVDEGTPGIAPGEVLDFWSKAERLVLKALEEYAGAARGAGVAHRRLFADDATHGFALADLASKKFDVVLTNPPFGQGLRKNYEYLRSHYGGAHNDIYASFIRRANELAPEGRVGAITSRSFLLTPRLEGLRAADILPRLELLADLGLGVMDDAYVESAAYVLSSSRSHSLALDCRIDRKVSTDLLKDWSNAVDVNSDALSELPQKKILYALPKSVHDALVAGDRFEPAGGTAREGMKSFDNERFIRLWWEVASGEIGEGLNWEWMAKGGAHRYWFSPIYLVLNWAADGRALKAVNIDLNGSTAQVSQASDYWHRSGATYSKRSAKGFSARALPEGCIFTSNGPAVLPRAELDKFALLGWINSRQIRALLHVQSNFGDYSTGSIKNLPWQDAIGRASDELISLTRSCVEIHAQAYRGDETSPVFWPDGLKQSVLEMGQRRSLESEWHERTVAAWSTHLDEVAGLEDGPWVADLLEGGGSEDASSEDGDEEEISLGESSSEALISFCVGIAFGRFERPGRSRPEVPIDVFGRQLAPGKVAPGPAAHDGVLVDDPGHKDDLAASVAAAYEYVREAPPEGLRHVLGRDFFAAHIRMYSRGRRRAPMYWQLATPSARYSVWLYIHALGKDTLFRVQNDYVGPKLAHERRELEGVLAEAGASPTTAQSRAIEAQRALVEELSALLDEVRRVAPLWDPDLDDGVILNFAPLWRLVPQNRTWQKELRAAWAAMIDGDYDWAHLSMRLWPERVVPKCAKDRSLAIAHRLEDVFWIEDAAGKWQARSTPTRALEDLVAERTSPAVKAALQSLIEAPEPVAASGRGRPKKS